MNLKYRGAAYNASNPEDAGEVFEKAGIHHGMPYQAKTVKASLRQPREELIYRGARYTR